MRNLPVVKRRAPWVPAGLFAVLLIVSCLPQPTLQVSTLVSGLSKPWDLGWLPNGTMLVTERIGRLNVYADGPFKLPVVIAPGDIVAQGESGMLGLEVDPQFASNGYVYVCMASDIGGAADIRLVRFTLSQDGRQVLSRQDIVTGIPFNGGRHGGCRPRFGPDGYLWVGTGDATIASAPQDDGSLGGKVLRVTRWGAAAPGNPGGRRWYTKGHRNVQGIAFHEAGWGVSVEHGPSTDDEINVLVPGNYGWNPGPGYNESVPMTNLNQFPGAIEAIWSSGSPTIAPSGAEFLRGAQWGAYQGYLAVATLKASHLRLFPLATPEAGDPSSYFVGPIVETITDRGRLRSPRIGPDGNLYITTDGNNGSGQVLKVVPVLPPQ